MVERIHKLLAARGVASRRAAEELVAQGRVRVNGAVAQIGQSVEETDRIEVDGKPVAKRERLVTLMLHKPRGYVTTMSDDKGRRTVALLIPQEPRLFPIGRLDMDSEGLLLFTNDGDLAQKLMHPRGEIDKVYRVMVENYRDEAQELLRRPIELDGRRIHPPGVTLLGQSGNRATLEITIHEGRNRQIRRMCAAAGLNVLRLKRVREGGLSLGDLRPGHWRMLTEEELRDLTKETT